MGPGGIEQASKKRPPQTYRMISNETFSKREHLLKTKDFRNVYNKGLSCKKGPYILYILPNALGHNRIGFSISTRNVKLATRRNRLKRVLREVYRKRKKNLRRGFDMAVVAKRGLGDSIDYKRIEEIFLTLTKEAGLSA
jgi:ribonuclease P protein component